MEKVNEEKYLPIGTVVLLKKANKRIMIVGFCCTAKNDNKKVYDYSGCPYPEGIYNSEKTLLFNHADIEEIYFMGLRDEEEADFKKRLKEHLKNYNM